MTFTSAVNAGSFAGFVLLFGVAVAWYTKIVRPEQVAFEARATAERQRAAEEREIERDRTDKALKEMGERVGRLEGELELCRDEHHEKDVRMAKLERAIIMAGGEIPP